MRREIIFLILIIAPISYMISSGSDAPPLAIPAGSWEHQAGYYEYENLIKNQENKMQKNGIYPEKDGYNWSLSVVSATKTRRQYKGVGFRTRIEAAYDYLRSVMRHDPKTAEMLDGKPIEEQFKILGVNL